MVFGGDVSCIFMSINPAQLPDDVQALKALVVKLESDYERR